MFRSQQVAVSSPRTAGSPTRRRLPTLLATFAAVLSGFFVAVAPTSAAHADLTGPSVYCEEHRLPDGRRIVVCWPLDVVYQKIRPTPDPCLSCPPYAVQFTWSLVLPDPTVSLVANGMLDGLHNLIAASIAGDEKTRDAYRQAAWESYGKAASNLGKANLTVGEVWVRYKDGSGDPEPQPNKSLFEQYGRSAILGLDLLRAAAADPGKAAQYQQQAQVDFDQAAAAFIKAIQAG